MTSHTLEDYQSALTAVQAAHQELLKFDRELWASSVKEIASNIQNNINRLSPAQNGIIIRVNLVSDGFYNSFEPANVVIPATPSILEYFDDDSMKSVSDKAFAELMEFFVQRKYGDRNQDAPIPEDITSWKQELNFSDSYYDDKDISTHKVVALIKYANGVFGRLGEDHKTEYFESWDKRKYTPVRSVTTIMKRQYFMELLYPELDKVS